MARSVYVPQAGGFISFKDDASDADITTYLRAKFPAPVAPTPAPPLVPTSDDVGPWESSGLGWLSRFQTAGGGIAEMLGADEAAKSMYDAAQANLDEANKYQPPEDQGMLNWLSDTAIQSAPDLAGGLAASVAGAKAGAGIGALVGAGTPAEVATVPIGATIGGIAGALAYGFGPALGGNIQEQARENNTSLQEANEGTAALAAVPQAALDALADRILIGRLLPGNLPQNIVRKVVGDGVIKHVIKGGLTEGLTEGAQQAIQIGQANPERLFEFGPEVQSELAQAAIAGGILGGAVGGASVPAEKAINYYNTRGERQLERDLKAERQQNNADMARMRINQTADEMRDFNTEGPVSVEKEEIDGISAYSIKDSAGNTFGRFLSPADAESAVEAYKANSGAKVFVAPKVEAPKAFPVKIGNKQYDTLDEVVAERDSLIAQRDAVAKYMEDPALLKTHAKAQKVSESFYKGVVIKEVEKSNVKIKTLDNFIAATQGKTPEAEVSPPEKTVPKEAIPEGLAAEELQPAETEANNDQPVAEDETPITEEEIAAQEAPPVEAPVEEPRYIDEAAPLPEGETPAPLRQEMRTTATAEQLADLQMELFGAPINIREMTDEQRAQYEAARDERYPQEPVDIYYRAGQADAAPEARPYQGPFQPRDFTPEFRAKIDNVYTRLENLVKPIVPEGTTLKLKTSLTDKPGYLIKGEARVGDKVIELATGIFDPNASVEEMVAKLADTMNHEAIHILRGTGLFKTAEWNMLSRAVANQKVPGKKYTYLDKARAIYGENLSEAYANDEAVIEEAVAEFYKDWVKRKNVKEARPVGGLLNRVTEFLRRLFRVMRDTNFEQVFKDIDAGKVKDRTPSENLDADGGIDDVTRFSAALVEPKRTVKAYKLFRERDGQLYPLFVNARTPVPVGEWLRAEAGELRPDGRVKATIGNGLAYRPGWHAGDLPVATHIGGRSHGNNKLPPDYRKPDEVWAEVEMADDVDWQKIADSRARMSKKGTPVASTAHITDQVPYGGFYRYKTNPSMTGNWLIGGDMRIVRILSDDEVKQINDAAGVADLPRTPERKFSAAPVDPEEFQRWFRQSKVVNEDGTPKVVYHGTKAKFRAFDTTKNDAGSHFGTIAQANSFTYGDPAKMTDPDYEEEYLMEGTTHQIFPVYLSIQNPLRLEDRGNWHPFRLMPQLVERGIATFEQRVMVREMMDQDREREAIKFMQDLIKKAGYDGIVYLNKHEGLRSNPYQAEYDSIDIEDDAMFKRAFPEAEDSYIVFDPEQVKSTLNPFEKGAAEDKRFSAAPLPLYVETQNQTLFAQTPQKTLFQSLSDFFSNPRKGLNFKAKVIDNAAIVEHLERKRNLQNTGEAKLDQADISATVNMTFNRRASHLLASSLDMGHVKVNYARPGDIQSATLTVEENPENLAAVFKVLLEDGPADPVTGKPRTKMEVLKSYAAAVRAQKLRAAGKQVPAQIDNTYINTIIPFTQQNYPEVVQAYEMYQRINKRTMETLRDAGAISDAELANLTRDMDYYGFYRELYNEELAPHIGSKMAGKFKFREFQGSDVGNLVADPMWVILKNMHYLIDAASKNIATTKVFNLARDMGEARLLGTSEQPNQSIGEAPEVMFFKDKGVLKRFAVKDPLLVMALGSDDRADIGAAMKWLGLPTKVIRETVTREPGFMIANLLRDTVASWVTSGENITPFLGTARGAADALRNGVSFRALRARGVVGSYDLAMMGTDEMSATLRRRLTPKNVHLMTSPGEVMDIVKMGWDKLGVWSEASDAATRIAVYEAAKREGASEAEAAYRAIKIMDFSRRGGSQFLGLLTKVIPFLNARIQGLDVLGQAIGAAWRVGRGTSRDARDANLGKKFLVRGALLMAISLALEWMNEKDDDYKDLPDYVKTGNLLIPLSPLGLKGQFIGIPKAFEPGLIFSTLPQQFYKTMTGQASTRDNMNLFTSSFASTFLVNPIPQALLPLVEIATNHDFYTGLPLISEGKMRLAPELQYDARTSSVARAVGSVPIWYNLDTGRFEGMSPILIEKLISGYGGPLSMMLVTGAGMIMDGMDIGPETLPKSYAQLPAIRRVFIDAESKNPKSVQEAYELFRIIDETNRSFSRLKQTGDTEALLAYYEDNKDILRYKKYGYKLFDRLNKLSAYERQIERSNMPRAEKLAAMERLREARSQLTAKVAEINKQLGR